MLSKDKRKIIALTITSCIILTLTSLRSTIQKSSDTYSSQHYVPVTNLRAIANSKLEGTTTTGSRTMADFRYLTLGSSVTYGVGLVNRYSAYPYLLSPDRHKLVNIAVKHADVMTSSPSMLYPSVSCLRQTISQYTRNNDYDGNEEFDVIIIEHDIINWNGLYELTKILRIRYPDAIIILLCLWAPGHLDWYDTLQNNNNNNNNEKTQKRGTFHTWAKVNNVAFYNSISTQKFHELDLRWPDLSQLNQLHAQIMQDFNVNLYFLLLEGGAATVNGNDPKEMLVKYKHYFQNDFIHLSDFGHKNVFRGLQEIVHDVAHQRSNILLQVPHVGRWVVGEGENSGGNGIMESGGSFGGEFDSGVCPSLNADAESTR